jgi:hypothetical protein
MTYVSDFFAGAVICNGLPHLLSGLQGIPFPSPFAKPPGVGDSSPIVNVLWGSFNLLVGILLLAWHPVVVGFHRDFAVLAVGFVLMGWGTAHQFGKVRAARLAR